MKTLIFDLDETVINSKHRTPYFENGDLDLARYKAMQTHKNIFKDTLLPLAKIMKREYKAGKTIIILTAREMTKSDYHFLKFHNLKSHVILSRNNIESEHFNLTDSEYKLRHLKIANIDIKNAIMYDDNRKVKSVLRKHGLTVQCAIKVNKKLGKI